MTTGTKGDYREASYVEAESHTPGIPGKLHVDTASSKGSSSTTQYKDEDGEGVPEPKQQHIDSDSDEGSEYLSFAEDDDDDDDDDDPDDLEATEEERMARERERQMVLEAAGLLIVQGKDGEAPPTVPQRRVLVRAKSRGKKRGKQNVVAKEVKGGSPSRGSPSRGVEVEESSAQQQKPSSPSTPAQPLPKRRPAPATPVRRRPRRLLSQDKDLPPIPIDDEEKTPVVDHATQLDDAYARYESFRNSQHQQQANNNRLSIISTDSATTSYSSPTSSFTLVSQGGSGVSPLTGPSPRPDAPPSSTKETESPSNYSHHRYSHFLNFLRAKTPEPAGEDPTTPKKLMISGPMVLGSHPGGPTALPPGGLSPQPSMNEIKASSTHSLSAVPESPLQQSFGGGLAGSPVISAPLSSSGGLRVGSSEDPSREPSPGFGTSWASLVEKTALEGIPVHERKRQEAIFELIHTEVAYVRDLQLIVEVFYSSMLEVLSQKEITVVFANVEDILLTNTAFLSSLEERQKDCRLYVDRIGDIILSHLPNMGVYMEYCVNQNTANKVLQSLKQTNPALVEHLKKLKENPAVRNLDLSSYLLEPMQRITRYPLLIKQISHYTSSSEAVDTLEQKDMATALELSEKLLGNINETIREQEGREILQKLSAGGLWIGQGRLDLTAPTRFMGPRKLLKQGVVMKAKSGRKLKAYLCSDILVLTDETGRSLYRMPIPLAHAQVKESSGILREGDHAFQVLQPYPRGGDAIGLKAQNAKESKQWIHDIDHAIRKCRHAEERAARKGLR